MNKSSPAVATLLAIVLSAPVVAEESGVAADPDFVPARFAGGLDAASAKIRFPDYERDVSVYINCAAKLSKSGEVERYFCLDYYGVRDTKFRQAAEAFIESAVLTPAIVDGEPRSVEIYFRVFFGRKGDLYAAGVMPNWGDDAERLGVEYEAPQRYNEDSPPPNCGTVAGISRVEVGEDGRAAGDVDLVMSYGVPEHIGTCESWMMQVVSEGLYIPAHHDGKPVAATYVELRGDAEWFTLKEPEGL